MCEDGLIHRDWEGGKSCLKAFTMAKNAKKGAPIADLRALNSLLVKPLPFPLPSLSNLGSLFRICKQLGHFLFFAKLDILNMY